MKILPAAMGVIWGIVAAAWSAAPEINTTRLPDAVRARQVRDMKWGMFVCWSFSTFSGREWTPTRGKDASYFKATGCDTDQWCRTAKDAGMGYILFLAKHHDGFCLWDTRTTEKKVTNSPIGVDVIARLRESCDKHGIKLALYFSEGDWNWPGAVDGKRNGGKNPDLKKAQLKELLTRYGPIEFWWIDHAIGTGGLSHQATVEWMHTFQPNTFVGFNHGTPAGRLCLRERGRPGKIGDKNASKYNKDAEGSFKGYHVAEFTYPILPRHRGGAQWFYSLPKHDNLCHPASKVYKDYRGAMTFGNIFSINIGPNYAGKIRDVDVKTLRQVGRMIRAEDAGQKPKARSSALHYPGTAPGKASRSVGPGRASLENAAIRGEWRLEKGRITAVSIENRHTGQKVTIGPGHLPRVVLDGGRTIDLASLSPAEAPGVQNSAIVAAFRDAASGLAMRWSATLDDGANAIVQALHLTASRDTRIKELVFVDAPLNGARQAGRVDGSVVVCGDIFLAVEHPLAKNTVTGGSHVRCALPRGNVLKGGQSWTHTGVIGVVPPGQLRRGFLYTLERRRARPYRPFLHYNNWYDVVLARPVERATEAECLKTVEHFGRELVRKRGVKMDAFVWDDGWDDFNSLWRFHKGFPNGFRKLKAAAAAYGAAQGVWMSPWGGYGQAKAKRLAHGKAQGYETNRGGFSMAGAKYRAAFRNVCLNMMRDHGVVFFKFDGMGGGNKATGADAGMADDIDAVLDLTRTLRRQNPDVFISATVGTWASPFWTLYSDSIWRQGGDTGFHGKGDTRQQWITYRDTYCHERIVQLGPLYPLNSLMLHGPCIGDRRAPARMVRNEKSVADEIWSFFASGTNLQELYITPRLLTAQMWDALAAAAKWARANSDVLVDTHWIGGDPGRAQVYGWASWRPGKGILALRNPSDKPQAFSITPKAALELPAGVTGAMALTPIYPRARQLPAGALNVSRPLNLTLQPFEVVVAELREPK